MVFAAKETPIVHTLPAGPNFIALHDPLPRTARRLVHFERPAIDSVSFRYGLVARAS
jgi:hypothetical protein